MYFMSSIIILYTTIHKKENNMTMEVKDIWKFKDGAAVYGYCECGREVEYTKDYKCPCCGTMLEWKKIKDINRIY